MSCSEPFYFFLPHLKEEGLIEDDSDSYALCLYPRDVISTSVMPIIGEYNKNIDGLNVAKKKRVKIIMEHLAVALSLRIQYCSHISTARQIYRKWLEDPSLFGSQERQNKFICRIIKQLSLPFDINEPASPHHFKNMFYPLLTTILGDYKWMNLEKGSTYSKETWVTLFNVVVGITDRLISYNFSTLLSDTESSDLRAMAVDTCCTVIETCGLRDEDMWNRFIKYMQRWSENRSTLRTWGIHVKTLFQLVLSRLYNYKPEEDIQLKGVYVDKPLTDEMLFFIFQKVLFSIDKTVACKSAKLLKIYTDTLYEITEITKACADSASQFQEIRFPLEAYLKLFGSFITSVPVLDDDFDSATSTLISSILTIISHFEFNPEDPIIAKLIIYVIQRLDKDHPASVSTFFKQASDLYLHNTAILPFVAQKTLAILNTCPIAKIISQTKGDSLCYSVASAFISACTFAVDKTEIPAIFKNLLPTMKPYHAKYMLFTNPIVDSVPIVASFFAPSTFSSILNEPSNVCFYNAMLASIGVLSRNKQISDDVKRSKLIQQIVPCLAKTETTRIEGASSMIASALVLFATLIEWSSDILADSEIVSSMFDLIIFMQNQMKHTSKSKAKKVADTWFDKHKHCMQSLISWITSRMNNHTPSADHFTHRLNSDIEINESKFASKDIRYFTIGSSLLVSFAEGEPLKMLVRGPFGKSFWQITDDIQGDIPTPEEINSTQAPVPKPEPITPDNLELELTSSPSSEIKIISKGDQDLRNAYASDFVKWLNWKQFGYYEDFNGKSPYQRPRVCDYLSTLGLINVGNKLQIREQSAEKIRDIISEFDALEEIALVPLFVQHVISADNDLEYSAQLANRMTPLMAQFMASIGEPMNIKQTEAIPKLKTTAPIIPSLNSFITLISPAMAADANGAKQIFENFNTTSIVKIIFNESDFTIKVPSEKRSKQTVIVVHPEPSGLYHVTEVQSQRDIMSPFAHEQTISIQLLTYKIAIIYEQLFRTIYKKVMPDLSKLRSELIKSLTESDNQNDFGAALTTAFALK